MERALCFKAADSIHFILQTASADTEKKFIDMWLMMMPTEIFPLKAISLPELQVQKQRHEIVLWVARQCVKQKAAFLSFISCVQRHEIRLRLF